MFKKILTLNLVVVGFAISVMAPPNPNLNPLKRLQVASLAPDILWPDAPPPSPAASPLATPGKKNERRFSPLSRPCVAYDGDMGHLDLTESPKKRDGKG
jgi:hypothetical protein